MDLHSSRERLLLLRVLAAVLLLTVNGVCGITEADLLPFGAGTPDLTLPSGDDEFANVMDTFMYTGFQVQDILITTGGLISLDQDSTGTILVFEAGVDTTAAGAIYYRQRSGDIGILERYVEAAAAIDSRFAGCYDQVFTGTWDSVGYFDQNNDPLNTFQGHIVYSSTSSDTLVIFLYPENGINWTTGDAEGGNNGLGGTPARVGLTSIQGNVLLQQSGTSAIVDIESLSNVGIPGVFVYKVDTSIFEPDQLVGGTDVVCDMVSGVSGVSSSGSGDPGSGPPGSGDRGCIFAGFTTCCVPSANQSCVVNEGQMNMCSCDVECFANDNCCFDITEVPCLPDIFVGFVPQNYTVTEGDDYVIVNVSASGFPGAPFDVVDNISVLLTHEDGTAEASVDFVGIIRELNFSSDGYWEVMIRILDNSPVELTEFFLARLATDNPFVVFNNDVATVEIIDNDRLVVMLEDPIDTPEIVQTADVCVSVVSGVLQAGLEAVVTVNVVPNDPEDLADFGAGPFDLTFESGDTIQCQPVPIRTDDLIEGNETFTIFIVDTSPMVDVDNIDPQDIVILDSTVGTVALDGAPSPVVESTGSAQVCAVIADAQLERDVEASITTSPFVPLSATDPEDYTGGIFTLLFESPNTRVCTNIPIAMDDIFEADELFLVIVSSNDPALTPGFLISAPVIILDETEIPFDFTDILGVYFASEGGVATVCVAVVGNLDRPVTITLTTSDVTAISTDDYLPRSVELMFSASQSEVCTDISLLVDGVVEVPENFNVSLSSDDSEVRFIRDVGQVFIVDTTKVDIAFEMDEYVVQESAGSVTVCVEQTSSPPVSFSRQVTLIFDTLPGTASALDFTSVVNNQIEFPSTRCISIDIIDDDTFEPNETFSVVVSSNDPAVVVVDDEATVIITDEPIVAIGIEFPAYTVGEGGNSVEVCVVANGLLSQDVRIFLLSEDATATSGSGSDSDDFETISENLILMAGNFPRVCVNVSIIDDEADEEQEVFTIRLTNQDSVSQFRSVANVLIEDNDQVMFSFGLPSYTVTESANLVTVCARVDRPLERDGVEVELTTSDGSASSGSDYIDISQTITFNSGDQEMCVSITILGDSTVEQQETFFVSLLDSTVLVDTAPVSIIDTTRVNIAFEMDEYVVQESAGSVTVCVEQTSSPPISFSRPVLITFNTVPGTASAPMDFTSVVNNQIEFPSTRCISININDDNTFEPVDETFSVVVSSNDPAVVVVDNEATVRITDIPIVAIGIEFPAYTVGEGGNSVEVCVVANGLLSQDVQISLFSEDATATSGSGSDSDDFETFFESLTLMAGNFPRACVDVSIIDDEADEEQEVFTIRLTNQDSVSQFRSVANVLIEDNDQVMFSFGLPSYTVTESANLVTVCARVDRPLERDGVEVELTTSDGSASSGSDYIDISQTITFNSGDQEICVSITILGDSTVEQQETFFVSLLDSTVLVDTAPVSIIDTTRVNIAFELEEYVVEESAGSVTVCVEQTSSPPVSFSRPVLITFNTVPGTASAPMDFTSVVNNQIVFTSTRCISIDIIDDDTFEPVDETFSVVVSSNDPAVVVVDNEATVRITDIPIVAIGIELSAYTVGEGGNSVEVCVVANGLLSQDVRIFLLSEDATATSGSGSDSDDFETISESLILMAGNFPRACVDVSIIDDEADEEQEVFTIRLTNQDSVPQFRSVANVLIEDNDQVLVNFVPQQYTVTESDNIVTVCARVDRPLERDGVEVELTTSDGSASSGSDYSGISQTVTFNSGDQEMCVDITIVNDSIVEQQQEMFFVNLLFSTDEGVFNRQGVVTIQDDDVDVVTLSLEEVVYVVIETDTSQILSVCVVAATAVNRDGVTVFVNSGAFTGEAMAGSDYVTVNDVVTFNTGDMVICVDVTILGDTVPEDTERFFIFISSNDANIGQSNSIVTIRDDDITGPVFGFDTSQGLIFSEGDRNAEVCVVVVSGTVTQNTAVGVGSGRPGDTATAPADYAAVSQTLIFTPGGPTRMCVPIDINDDNIGENSESFTLTLDTNTQPTATVTITDNEPGPVFGFDTSQGLIFSEGDGSVEVCVVVVSGTVTQNTAVGVGSGRPGDTATAPADYAAVSQTLIFTPGGPTRMCVPIDINDDNIGENSESFTLTLDTNTQPTATVTITDNEPEPVFGFDTSQGLIFSEGDRNAEVCVVVVSGTVTQNTAVEVGSGQPGDTATEDEDYTAVSQTLIFTPGGPTRMCVPIDINDDNIGENSESFTLILDTNTQPTAIVTITDNEPGPVFGFDTSQGLIFSEGDGSVEVCVVVVSGTVTQNTAVAVGSGQPGDTATAPADYAAVSQTLIFTPGGPTRMCVTVFINDDVVEENTEMFTLTLNSQPAATVTIIDNDPPDPVFGFDTSQGLVFSEGDENVEVCVVVVSGTVTQNTAVGVGSGQPGDTATAPADYAAVSQTLIFTPGGPTRMCVPIDINDDVDEENTEMFTLTLNSQPAATVTINDDDADAEIGLEQPSYVVSEDEEAVRVCVSVSQGVTGIVTAELTTSDISAVAGSDYVPLSISLTFPADDRRMCVEIDVIDDDVGEAFESFLVLLTNSNLQIFRSQAIVNILQDSDGLLVVTLQEPVMAVDEGRAIVPVCVDFLGSTLERQVIVRLTTSSDSALDTIDFIGESTDITYLPTIAEVIICENITIINDQVEESFEIFRVTLSSSDPAVSFRVSSGVVIIVDDDELDLSAGFVQTDIRVLETGANELTSARLRAFVNGRIVQPVTLQISIVGGTATVGEDYNDAAGVLVFNSNADNALREFYTIIGDDVIESDETVLFQLSSPDVPLIQGRTDAVVTIVNDDSIPTESGAIVLIDDTPEVTLDFGGQTVSVRVAFTLSAGAVSATCALQELIPATDCSQGTLIFTGLPSSRQPPLRLEITASDQFGDQVAFISRAVRLGFNGDCAVNFLNGVEEAQVFQGLVFIEFSLIGPVTQTECRLDNGSFIPCQSPVQFDDLSVGQHSVKVRPAGDNCVRRIRRTVDFTVV